MPGLLGSSPPDMQVFAVERFFHLLCPCSPLRLVFFQVLQGGEALHDVEQFDVISRRNQCPVGDACRVFAMNQFQRFGRNAPVSVFVFGNQPVLHVFPAQVKHPFADGRVAPFHRFPVSELGVKHVAGERKHGRPGDIVIIIHPESRSDIAEASVLALGFADVTCPFAIKRVDVEQVTFAPASHGAVAQPRLAFVALGTIDGHAFIVS